MPEPRALTANAADPEQVKNAGRIARRATERMLLALKNVMSTHDGRMVMWGLLERCGVFNSVMHPSGSLTYYNAGKQDVGHEVMAELLKLDEKLYLQMQAEAINRASTKNVEADANTTRETTQ